MSTELLVSPPAIGGRAAGALNAVALEVVDFHRWLPFFDLAFLNSLVFVYELVVRTIA